MKLRLRTTFVVSIAALGIALWAVVGARADGVVMPPTVYSNVVKVESEIAGKPVGVDCYYSPDAWRARYTAAGYVIPDNLYINAFTYIGTGPVELGDQICTSLTKNLNHLTSFQIGQLIDVLAHEPQHAYGITDEKQAESCAHRYEALVVHEVFGVAYHTAKMRLWVAIALNWSRGAVIGSYQGGTCPR